MSLPTDPLAELRPDPHADPLVASAVRAAADAPAAGCPEAELLALYAERALSTSDLALVHPHLDGCPRCQAIVAACVRALPEGSEPMSEAAGAFDTGANVRSWFAGWRWLVPITSVATVAVVAVWIGRAPTDQVAEQAKPGAQTLESPVPSTSADNARLVPGAPAVEADRQASTSGRMSAEGQRLERAGNAAASAPAGRRDAPRDEGVAAPVPPATLALRLPERSEPLPTPSEEARAKTAKAEAGRDARLADPAAAPPASTFRASAAEAPAPAVAAPAAPTAPAPVTLGARASGAAAGSAGNEVGAAKAREAVMVTLTGTITYRARVTLPPGAVIDVRLLDVSGADPSTSLRAGAPAETIARAEIVTRGEQVPVAFSLPYDPDAIQPRRRYVVHATIAVEGRVAWRTTTQHPVFVDGAAPASAVTIVVDQIR